MDAEQLLTAPLIEEEFRNEVEILKKIDHPHVIRVYEYFMDAKSFHLVTDLCQGGEVFDYLVKNEQLSESIACKIMTQLISAMVYFHQNNIVHRDIKPENLLLESKPGKNGENINIKVIDFGTAKLTEPNKIMTQNQGTPYYVAPEVIKGNYDEKCDVWSAGVILYTLLCGHPPFQGDSSWQVIKLIRKGKYEFKDLIWKSISNPAKDLITKILVPANKRLTAAQVLQHPWIANQQHQFSVPKSFHNSLQNLKHFHADRKLQQATLAYITSQLINENDIKDLRATFQKFDKNGDGKLSREELVEGYSEIMGDDLAALEAEKIFEEVDTDKSGFIDYSEFVQAAMDKSKLLSKKNLAAAFRKFDTDGSGTLSLSELQEVLQPMQVEPIGQKMLQKILREADSDGNGEIDLAEFERMMRKVL